MPSCCTIFLVASQGLLYTIGVPPTPCNCIRSPELKIPEGLKTIRLDFSSAPIIGVLILLITQTISLNDVLFGIVGNEQIQPWAIMILFFSLAYICVSLDSSGIYNYLALKAVVATKGSGMKLFFAFFFLSSAFTVITSNDIVILTLTPIISYFTTQTKTDPIPYLMAQFFASNIWSITLLIGNPTNIIVGLAFNISFVKYTAWMLLPAIASGFTCLLLVWLVFRKRIPVKVDMPSFDPSLGLRDKFAAIYGLTCLISCLILLAISEWTHIPVWTVTLFFGVLMLVRDIYADFRDFHWHKKNIPYKLQPTHEDAHDTIVMQSVESGTLHDDHHDETSPFNFNPPKLSWKEGCTMTTVNRLPWKIVPFVLGMFIMVASLDSTGWISIFAKGRNTADSLNLIL